MKGDLKKIGLKIIDGFKSIFINFFTEIREMIRFMANWLVEIRILRGAWIMSLFCHFCRWNIWYYINVSDMTTDVVVI